MFPTKRWINILAEVLCLKVRSLCENKGCKLSKCGADIPDHIVDSGDVRLV